MGLPHECPHWATELGYRFDSVGFEGQVGREFAYASRFRRPILGRFGLSVGDCLVGWVALLLKTPPQFEFKLRLAGRMHFAGGCLLLAVSI